MTTFKAGQRVRVATFMLDGTTDWSAEATVLPRTSDMPTDPRYVPVWFKGDKRNGGLMVPCEQIMANNL